MSGLAVAADLLILNLLTVVCSLPIVTIGASITSMNAVCIRLVRGESNSVLSEFFRSFRSNFKKGTLLGLLLLAVSALLYFDYLAAQNYVPAFLIGITAIAILFLAVFEISFAMLARYENTLLLTLKNSALLAVAYFPRTLLMLMFSIGFWLACVVFFRIMGYVLFMFGLSLPCYVSCMLLREIFNKLEEKQTESSLSQEDSIND